MVKLLLILNTLLTLPFGVLALASPGPLFSQFGLQLDAAGLLIARGYGATLVGFGLVLFLTRSTTEPRLVHVLLCSLVAFNAIEATIQALAGVQAVAQPIIFANATLHGAVALACLFALARQRS